MVLIFFLALAIGFISLAFVSHRSHSRFSPLPEALVAPLLFYNLWILIRLAFRYVETTVLIDLPFPLGRVLVTGLIWVSLVVIIQWAYSYLAFTLQAAQPDHSHNLIQATRKGARFVMVGMVFVFALLLFLDQDILIRHFARWLVSFIFLLVSALSLRFFFKTGHYQLEGPRRNLRVLAAAYSVIFVALTIFIWWYRFYSPVTEHSYINITVGFEIVYNAVTILWIRFFDPIPVRPEPNAVTVPIEPDPPTSTLQGTYGISKREEEVIHLVCQGLTNQEIADKLFISMKTVKDHNYRIFQKTGVRNRVELAQLVRNLGVKREGDLAPDSPVPTAAKK